LTYPIVLIKQPNRKPLYVQIRDTIEIGRECDGILLADAQVSRRHASLGLAGDHVVVEDLKSTNGTFLDGERVSAAIAVRPGCVVKVGDTTIELVVDAAPRETGTSVPAAARVTTVGGGAPDDGLVRASGDQVPGARETSIDVLAREVRSTRPEITPDEFEGTITIVFSDIESSTERATSMGDTAWMQVLSRHNELVRRHVKECRGREVKSQGDGFMLTFAGVRRALHCMIGIQRELDEWARSSPEDSVSIRVGVHTGEVIVDGGDIFGRHVMMAARVAGAAHGNEILASSLVREIASARGDITFGEGRIVALKGIDGEHTVYPVLWNQQH
jgi:class 3 adenylate cyclase